MLDKNQIITRALTLGFTKAVVNEGTLHLWNRLTCDFIRARDYHMFIYWVGDGYGDGFWRAQVQGIPSGNKLHETSGGRSYEHQMCVALDWILDCIEEMNTNGGREQTSAPNTGET